MNKYTEEIEDKANILLRDTFQKIFEEANLKLLVQEHFKEKGVDFTFEIETRELIPETIEFISLQNKGTLNKVTPLKTTSKKGFISFQIDDIRHIDYWCQQLDRPFIFTLCDLTTNTIYWTALQLERDIYLKRVSELKLKSSRNRARSLQIYIDPKQKLIQNNIPCHDNFKVLFDQIQASKKIIIQREEDKFHFEKIDKFAFIEVDRSLHILDQLYQYMKIRFEFINILPHGFWARQYPFKVDKFPYFEYQNFTLHTDNKEIFDIFESIEIEKEEQVVLKNSIFFDGVKEVLEKIKFILDILNQNLVFNISCRPNNKIKSIRIFLKDTSIGSPSNFFNFRFDEVVHKISRTSSEDDKSQLAFLHYKLGNYVKAATIYLDLLVDVENVRKSSKYFIYAYNLSKLELFVRNRFSNEPIDDNLLSKLKRVKVVFENSTTLLNGDALISKWLKQRLFFWEMESSIGERCESLKEFYFLLQNGGLGSNSIVWDIYVEHAMLLSFIELNQLVCDFNQEFSRLNEKVIESFLMSYSIDDSIASKLENFDDWHLKLMVLYSRPSKLKNFLIRFEISSIRYAPSSRGADGFVALFRNFFTSISLIRTDDAWSESWEFDGKFRDILGNLVLLASYLELSDEDILGIGVLIYDFLKSDRLINTPLELKYIYGFIRMKGHLLGEKLFEKYFDLFIRSSELLNEEFAASLCAVSEKADWFIEFDMDRLELILTYHKELNNEKRGLFDLKVLVYISRLIKSGLTQEKLQNIILSKLIERFDWRLYYLAVFYSVIPLESDCFEKFIKFDFNNDGSRFNNFNYYKLNRFRDFRIGAIINLAYKFNIDLTNAQFDHFRGIEPYYDWLLDMENFDYSKFEPSWISEYSTIFYLRRMSKIVKLIQSILNYQDNKPNSFLRQHILTILRLHFDGK